LAAPRINQRPVLHRKPVQGFERAEDQQRAFAALAVAAVGASVLRTVLPRRASGRSPGARLADGLQHVLRRLVLADTVDDAPTSARKQVLFFKQKPAIITFASTSATGRIVGPGPISTE
jgi:hypothetical protein